MKGANKVRRVLTRLQNELAVFWDLYGVEGMFERLQIKILEVTKKKSRKKLRNLKIKYLTDYRPFYNFISDKPNNEKYYIDGETICILKQKNSEECASCMGSVNLRTGVKKEKLTGSVMQEYYLCADCI